MKKIVALILTAVMLMSMSAMLFACNNDNQPDQGTNEGNNDNKETKVNYTVTVTDTDGNPIKGAVITFSPKGSMSVPFSTDEEGKASYKTNKEMTAVVTSVPKGYECAQLGKSLSFDQDGKASVVVSKVEVELYFIIKVVDEEGNPISGVIVQMCDDGGSCRKPVTTGDDGTAGYAYESGSFHAQLTQLPDGYTVDDVAKYYIFENGVATITLTKLAD